MFKSNILKGALAGVMMLLGTAAHAEYPEKPVNFIVPWPPGDLEDVLTRMIADDFQAKYGVAAAVVNKPGGGGGPFPGAIDVATAPPDGYTIGSFVIGVPVVGHTIEFFRRHPRMYRIVHPNGRPAGAVTQAIDRFKRKLAILTGFTTGDTQLLADMLFQGICAHGLARFRAA